MSIILEGPDAAGKTTLAQQLLKMEPRLTFYSSGGAPRTPEAMDRFCRDQDNLSTKYGVILDRITPISHPIYNMIGSEAQRELRFWLKSILSSQAHLVMVYCRPSNDLLMRPDKHQWKDYDTEADKMKILDQQHVFIERYDELFKTIPHVCYDYSATEVNVELVPLIAASQFSPDAYKAIRTLIDESKRHCLT
jgi:hypothetical protein